MSRKLLGYVVKLPDGTRSPSTPRPWPLAEAVNHVFGVQRNGVVVAVYARPKAPKPAAVDEGERYAVLVQRTVGAVGSFVGLDYVHNETSARDVGTRAEALGVGSQFARAEVVRLLPDGAHEAAVAEARREERERVIATLRKRLGKALELATKRADGRGLPNELASFAGEAAGLEEAICLLDDAAKAGAQ